MLSLVRVTTCVTGVACLALSLPAYAQVVDRRYEVAGTDGVAVPTALAGEHDALATTANPGGLGLLRGPELAVALNAADPETATTAGAGFGVYAATAGGGAVMPRLGVGVGLEWLYPPRAHDAADRGGAGIIDPGQPIRLTLAAAIGLGARSGMGISWHHFWGDSVYRGLDTFDIGVSHRFGPHFAAAAGLRDLSTATGSIAIERRYQLEVMARPWGSDLVALAIGERVGEARGDVDGWGRLTVRAARGVYVVGSLETRALRAFDVSPSGTTEHALRDVRLTLGVELSLGTLGLAGFATGVRDAGGANRALGGAFVATLAAVPRPSIIPPAKHVERVELSGTIDLRDLTALVMRLRSVARDPSAVGVVVMFDGVGGGWAQLQEIRNELLAIRRTRKKVFAYMVSGTSRDYYIASAADRIYLDPAGGIRLVGMASHAWYFRGAFDQIGVLPQFEKIGEYKTAPEQFTETGPTPVASRMRGELVDSLWSQWLTDVAAGRHLTKEVVAALVDRGPYTSADLADDRRLVDAVAMPDKVAQLMTAELGGDYGLGVPPIRRPERWKRPAIAVVYVDGDITDGESKSIPVIRQSLAGGQTLAAAIVAARSDPAIGAIVVRIDSPGGSAVASELVARQVFATRGIKPIICSMSNVAASGGYFIASACDAIYAEPTTITGSIGIFYGKFDVSGLIKKLGFGIDTTKRGDRADIDSWYRPYSDDERRVLMEKLGDMYDRFVDAVARGRKLTKAAVDTAGRGRVYTGEQAKPRSLVDHFGGIGDALDDAKRRMGLAADAAVELREYPKLPSVWAGFLTKLFGLHSERTAPVMESMLAALVRGVGASVLVAPDSPQARLPFDVVID